MVLLLGFIAYVANSVVEAWNEIDLSNFEIHPFAIVLFAVSSLTAYLFFSKSWQLTLAMFGERLSFLDSFIVYMKSQLGAYMPGKVGLVITKVMVAQKKGIGAKHTTIATSLEIAIQLYSQMIIGIASIFIVGVDLLGTNKLVLGGVAIGTLLLVVVFFTPKNFIRLVNTIFVKMKREPLTYFNEKGFYRVLPVKIVGNLFVGLGIFFAIRIIYPIDFEYILYIVCASNMAFFLGLIAVFAPSGIGVRDSFLIYLLGAIMPASIALVIAVLLRFATLISELTYVGVAYILDWKFGTNKQVRV